MAEEKKMQDIIADTYDEMQNAVEEPEVEVVAATEEVTDEEVEISAEATTEVTETDETNEVTAQSEQAEEVDDTPIYDKPAPERWTADMKETYDKLPPEARKMMVEDVFVPMQRQYTETTMNLSKMKEKVKPLLSIMEDYSGEFEKAGANPVEAIRRQAAWANHFLKVGVEQGVEDMRKEFGVGGGGNGQAQDEYLTPVERQLKSESNETRQMLNELRRERDQSAQRTTEDGRQARVQQVQKDLKSFIDEQKDGKPLHPHVEKVAPQIAGILKGGLVTQTDEYGQPVPFRTQMEQAYRMAVDMNPATRPAGGASRQRQVEKAKAAQDVSVVTTETSSGQNLPPVSLSQAIDDAYDKLAGRH